MLNSKRKANRFLLFSSDFFYTSACSWPGGILKAHSPAGERKRVTENLALVKVFVIDSERLSWGKKPSFFASNNIAKHPKHKQPENNRSHCLTWLEHVNAKNLAVSPTTWKSATWKSFSAYLTIQYNSWKWTAENKKALTNVNAVLLAEKPCTWRYKMATGKAVAIAHVWIWQNFPSPPCRSDIVMKRGWGSYRQNLRRMHLASDKSTSIYEKQHPSKRKESFG